MNFEQGVCQSLPVRADSPVNVLSSIQFVPCTKIDNELDGHIVTDNNTARDEERAESAFIKSKIALIQRVASGYRNIENSDSVINIDDMVQIAAIRLIKTYRKLHPQVIGDGLVVMHVHWAIREAIKVEVTGRNFVTQIGFNEEDKSAKDPFYSVLFKQIIGLIDKLPRMNAKVIKMSYLDELSGPEIADSLGISCSKVFRIRHSSLHKIARVSTSRVRIEKGLTQQELKRQLAYCKETGLFSRRIQKSGVKIGTVAKAIKPNGKIDKGIIIRVNGKRYHAHRLAYLYVLGRFPTGLVGQLNGDKTDNRWVNLREGLSKRHHSEKVLN